MKETEARNRDTYRVTLKQRKVVWQLWVEGNTAKQIAGQFRPSLADITIYKLFREFKNLSAHSLLAIYQGDGPPDLIIDKWKRYNIHSPKKIREFDELKRQKQPESNTLKASKENEGAIIAPPKCFQKDKMGRCRNVALRSDCGPCFYLRLGRTQEDIDRLIELTVNLPNRVQQTKESFLARDKKSNTS